MSQLGSLLVGFQKADEAVLFAQINIAPVSGLEMKDLIGFFFPGPVQEKVQRASR